MDSAVLGHPPAVSKQAAGDRCLGCGSPGEKDLTAERTSYRRQEKSVPSERTSDALMAEKHWVPWLHVHCWALTTPCFGLEVQRGGCWEWLHAAALCSLGGSPGTASVRREAARMLSEKLGCLCSKNSFPSSTG